MIAVLTDVKTPNFEEVVKQMMLGDNEKYFKALDDNGLTDKFIEEDKKNIQPIRIRKLTPIQMPHVDMDEVKNGRKAFTKEEWMDILLR